MAGNNLSIMQAQEEGKQADLFEAKPEIGREYFRSMGIDEEDIDTEMADWIEEARKAEQEAGIRK